MIKVLFFLVLVLPGHPPVPYQEEVASLGECLAMQKDALEVGPPAGGNIQAGCVLIDAGVKS